MCKFTFDNTHYEVPRTLLQHLFEVYGYCVDPVSRSGAALSPENQETLCAIAGITGTYTNVKRTTHVHNVDMHEIFVMIFEIGLCLKTVYDVVRMELEVHKLCQRLKSHPHYALVRDLQLVDGMSVQDHVQSLMTHSNLQSRAQVWIQSAKNYINVSA